MFKSFLITALTVLSITVTANSAQANDFVDIIGGIIDAVDRGNDNSSRYRDNYRRGNITCTYVDKGWEEHWGGHSSCQSCLKKHGSCIEKCYEEEYLCTATGLDSRGNMQQVRAASDRQWEAEDEALDRCSYRGLTECRLTGCNQESNLISNRQCRE